MGTYLLALLAKEIKVKYFIYTSSVSVYGSKLKNNITEKALLNLTQFTGFQNMLGNVYQTSVI